ncbi:MAG TPA: response regulator [Pyrinomonadaceae bacterium]|nr:response regulator [Pyrinomonadaceae bacterium]
MERKEPLVTSSLANTDHEVREKYPYNGAEKEFLILVADDSVDNVVVVSLDLQAEGYKVVTASNGEEAVNVARLTHPNLILMDISMPLLDGLAAARKIHEIEALQDVPVVAITALSTEGFQRAAYDVGVAGYLVKPIDFDRLHQLVRRLLGPQAA